MALPVERLTALNDRDLEELAELLRLVVDEGASIGFLPPLALDQARTYWRGVNPAKDMVFVVRQNDRIVGSVQVQPASSANGVHRGEVCKLIVHPGARRQGIARDLLAVAESAAAAHGITLVSLDTREGDPSNRLYQSVGYTRVGRIPDWARSANGALDATIFYYKQLA